MKPLREHSIEAAHRGMAGPTLAAVLAIACLSPASAIAGFVAPYSGTIFVDGDIITSDDPTTLVSVTPAGEGMRCMFDRRLNAYAVFDTWLFNAGYSDAPSIEIEVNQEFTAADARMEAEYYAPVVGRLPRALRDYVRKLWIHKGDEAFGGGPDALLIHTGSIAEGYKDEHIVEEALFHEATHTSIDARVANSTGWLAAQAADAPRFISDYAQDNPQREDVAESLLLWFADRFVPERLDPSDVSTIESTIPNRLAYFDSINFNALPAANSPGIFQGGFEGPYLGNFCQ